QREVVDARFPALDPELHVMCFDEPRAVTTRERAVSITRPNRAPNRRRHRALLATHGERRAALVLRDDDDARIARNALHRLERRVSPPRPSMEGCFVDVHDDLVAICRTGVRA